MPLAVLELEGNDYQNFAPDQGVGEKFELNDESQTYGTMGDTKVSSNN